jgi:hypothetical protein
MTMLGVSGSGKTTFLHGMYATLSSGINGYYLYATDPDVDLDLAEAWEELSLEGTLPKPNAEVPTPYEFVFKYGVRSLVEIDCVDFRGGAGTGRGDKPDAPADIAQLRSRVEASDSIFLVLDGQYVANWIRNGHPGNLNRAGERMGIAHFARDINLTVEARRLKDEPTLSLVVLVTKSDLLARITGLSSREALATVAEHLRNLVPVAMDEGVTTLLCPVQIGDFGEASSQSVDPGQVNPKNLHSPIIFALLHYLSEGISRHEQEIKRLDQQIDAQDEHLASLRSGLFGGFFKGDQVRGTRAQIMADKELRRFTQEQVEENRRRAALLSRELRDIPLFRNGELQ